MSSLKNTIEDIVVDEAETQIDFLGSAIKSQINLSEVVAYALNRLPPMYASTDRGWLQQRKRAHNELNQQITGAVRHAMIAVTRDPLRQVVPISQDEFETPAHSLAKLRQILNRPHLRWKEIPSAVNDALDEAKHGWTPNINVGNFSVSRRQVQEVKEYLKRSKIQGGTWRDKKLHPSDSNKFSEIVLETKEFQSYMLPTSFAFTNALEKLVVEIAFEQMQRLDSVLARHVKLEDAAAYTLNRLSPMYATSNQGLQHHRHRAQVELINNIVSTVIQSFLTLSKSPRRLVEPIPIAKFDAERDQAIEELKLILRRDDITWLNFPHAVEDAIAQMRDKTSAWRRQCDMLTELYQALNLEPGSVEFQLIHSENGAMMSIHVDQKPAFGILIDNPRTVGRIVMKFFPEVTYIELQTSLLTFPITYTRDEMVTDGIL
jgi:hypothetical protein